MTITVTHNLFQHLLFIEEILTFVRMTVINNGIVLNYNQLIFLFTAFTKKNAIACCWLHILLLLQSQNTEFSAVGSALRSGRRGRWFESSNSDKLDHQVGLFLCSLAKYWWFWTEVVSRLGRESLIDESLCSFWPKSWHFTSVKLSFLDKIAIFCK